MGNHDYGEAFRVAIGCLAFMSATWQLVMRVTWARPRHDAVGKRELIGAVATAVLLFGIGFAQITHLTLTVTFSAAIITIGIVLSLWTNYLIYRAIQYADADETRASRRRTVESAERRRGGPT